MNIINNKKNIHIHFVGLSLKEHAVFKRVINFNKAHGAHVQISEELATANLVIATELAFLQFGQLKNDPTVLVITENASLGDIQITRPLLVTRVMKVLEVAIKFADTKLEGARVKDVVSTRSIDSIESIKPIEKAVSERSQSGLHALVIDDSAAIRKQLELELRDSKIAVSFAESGEQAIEKIKQYQFDLIFLDVMMPGIDGYETCKLIRSDVKYKKTPIIMLSGKTSPLDEVQGIIAGATTYLTKPVKSENLQKVLARVIVWVNNFKEEEKKKIAVV